MYYNSNQVLDFSNSVSKGCQHTTSQVKEQIKHGNTVHFVMVVLDKFNFVGIVVKDTGHLYDFLNSA